MAIINRAIVETFGDLTISPNGTKTFEITDGNVYLSKLKTIANIKYKKFINIIIRHPDVRNGNQNIPF